MQTILKRRGSRFILAVAIFFTLLTAILARPPKWLSDFDQSFYITIAYDLVHHGVFSNGVFDKTDSVQDTPPPGRFFGPVYPAFLALMMKLDSRFATSVECNVENTEGHRPASDCEVYVTPVHVAHAAFLATGVVAIALTAELITGAVLAFWLAAALANAALLPDADLFSFVMTESLTFCLYALAALAFVSGLQRRHPLTLMLAGALFGLLTLTRAAYSILVVVIPVAMLVFFHAKHRSMRAAIPYIGVFCIGWMALVGPWVLRNKISMGDVGLTEEYGSAALIERFAFNDMTAREFVLAFPYCMPVVGPPAIGALFGAAAMDRFVYYTPRSFFHAGRLARDKLVESYGKLDPLIGRLLGDEMRRNWWRHLLVSVPLAWCGMWVGGLLGLVLLPMFGAGLFLSRGHPLRYLLVYSAPGFAMLALHALLANQYTRYNLILLGPLVTGAALAILRVSSARTAAAG